MLYLEGSQVNRLVPDQFQELRWAIVYMCNNILNIIEKVVENTAPQFKISKNMQGGWSKQCYKYYIPQPIIL